MTDLKTALKPVSAVFSIIRRSVFGGPQANLSRTLSTAGVLSVAAFGTLCPGAFHLGGAVSPETTLAAMQDTRMVLGRINNDIRSSQKLLVGNGDSQNFAQAQGNSLQEGNAVKIYPSADPAQFVTYYVDPVDQRLKRSRSDSQKVEVLADCIDRGAVFFGEDHLGHTLGAQSRARVVRMTLQTHPHGLTTGANAELCRLQTRMARRVVD